MSVLAAILALAAGPPSARSAPLPPAADAVETFSRAPVQGGRWAWTGTLSWSSIAPGAVTSSATRSVNATWTSGLYYAGTLTAKFKLISGRSAKATFVFARDPADPAAYRWVRVTAGAVGSVVLGQTGTIRGSLPRTIRTVRTPVPLNLWQTLVVTIDKAGKVTVKLGTKTLMAGIAASPLAPGQVGFATTTSRVAFDSFTFASNPDAEPCQECHAGGASTTFAQQGPDVYKYWDGSWWDTTYGGDPAVQQGGHGDPGGKALKAVTCTGATGCHDMRLPAKGDHRNGVNEALVRPSKNSYHLLQGFIKTAPTRSSDIQVTFDNYCAKTCHQAVATWVSSVVRGVPHELDSRYTRDPVGSVQMGQHLTISSAAGLPPDFPVDRNLSSLTSVGGPTYAPCVSCHDPHGTSIDTISGITLANGSNRMLRRRWGRASSELCVVCHI